RVGSGGWGSGGAGWGRGWGAPGRGGLPAPRPASGSKTLPNRDREGADASGWRRPWVLARRVRSLTVAVRRPLLNESARGDDGEARAHVARRVGADVGEVERSAGPAPPALAPGARLLL